MFFSVLASHDIRSALETALWIDAGLVVVTGALAFLLPMRASGGRGPRLTNTTAVLIIAICAAVAVAGLVLVARDTRDAPPAAAAAALRPRLPGGGHRRRA